MTFEELKEKFGDEYEVASLSGREVQEGRMSFDINLIEKKKYKPFTLQQMITCVGSIIVKHIDGNFIGVITGLIINGDDYSVCTEIGEFSAEDFIKEFTYWDGSKIGIEVKK